MGGKRQPLQHAGTAWRQQHALVGLQTAVVSIPAHDSIPCHLQAALHIALRYIRASTQPTEVSTAASTLRRALAAVPTAWQPFAATLLHAYMLLSLDTLRSSLVAHGAKVDDLAACNTWSLPLWAYGLLVHALGLQGAMLEAVPLLRASCTAPEVTSAADSLVGRAATAAPQLALPCLAAMCPPALPPPTAGGPLLEPSSGVGRRQCVCARVRVCVCVLLIVRVHWCSCCVMPCCLALQ